MEKRTFPDWLTPKRMAKTAIILPLTAMLAKIPMREGHSVFADESLWALIFFVILVNSGRKISGKTPNGWVWLSYFFYANAWRQHGISAWVYLTLACWCIWTFHKWKGASTHAVG